jgi:hypothetical protein
MIDLSLSSDEENFIADTSHDAEFTRKLFGDLNRNILGPPGDGKVIILDDSDDFCPLCGSSFSGAPRISKSFKLPTFWLLDSAFGLRGLLKQKCPFSREMNRHTVACYTYKAGAAEHVSSHRFLLLPSHLSCYFQSFPATHSGTSYSVLHG